MASDANETQVTPSATPTIQILDGAALWVAMEEIGFYGGKLQAQVWAAPDLPAFFWQVCADLVTQNQQIRQDHPVPVPTVNEALVARVRAQWPNLSDPWPLLLNLGEQLQQENLALRAAVSGRA